MPAEAPQMTGLRNHLLHEPALASGAGDRVQLAGGSDELEDFLADAVHVHGERNAAEADERDAKLFFPHEAAPGRVVTTGLVPAIHIFAFCRVPGRGCPAQVFGPDT